MMYTILKHLFFEIFIDHISPINITMCHNSVPGLLNTVGAKKTCTVIIASLQLYTVLVHFLAILQKLAAI